MVLSTWTKGLLLVPWGYLLWLPGVILDSLGDFMAGIYEPTCTAHVASSSYYGLPQVRPKIDREGKNRMRWRNFFSTMEERKCVLKIHVAHYRRVPKWEASSHFRFFLLTNRVTIKTSSLRTGSFYGGSGFEFMMIELIILMLSFKSSLSFKSYTPTTGSREK